MSTAVYAIASALILCALLSLIWGLFAPCGWSLCPDCAWWHHKDGRMQYDEPQTWDGVRCEKICRHCAVTNLDPAASHGESVVSDASGVGPKSI